MSVENASATKRFDAKRAKNRIPNSAISSCMLYSIFNQYYEIIIISFLLYWRFHHIPCSTNVHRSTIYVCRGYIDVYVEIGHHFQCLQCLQRFEGIPEYRQHPSSVQQQRQCGSVSPGTIFQHQMNMRDRIPLMVSTYLHSIHCRSASSHTSRTHVPPNGERDTPIFDVPLTLRR